jgi:hypothetical protein
MLFSFNSDDIILSSPEMKKMNKENDYLSYYSQFELVYLHEIKEIIISINWVCISVEDGERCL